MYSLFARGVELILISTPSISIFYSSVNINNVYTDYSLPLYFSYRFIIYIRFSEEFHSITSPHILPIEDTNILRIIDTMVR